MNAGAHGRSIADVLDLWVTGVPLDDALDELRSRYAELAALAGG